MSDEIVEVRVCLTEQEFIKRPPEDQMKILYSCLLDIQKKLTWNWRKMVMIGVTAGVIGGLFEEQLLPIILRAFAPAITP